MTDGDDGGGGEEDELKEIKVMDGMLSGYFSPGELCGDGEDYDATRSRRRGPKAADWHVSLIFRVRRLYQWKSDKSISLSETTRVWHRRRWILHEPPSSPLQQQQQLVWRRQEVLLDGSVLGAFFLLNSDHVIDRLAVNVKRSITVKTPAERPPSLFFIHSFVKVTLTSACFSAAGCYFIKKKR